MERTWKDEKELAAMLLVRSRQGRNVTLTPDTAALVAVALMHQADKPTRDEVARIICNFKCGGGSSRCFTCTGIANGIVAAYGRRQG